MNFNKSRLVVTAEQCCTQIVSLLAAALHEDWVASLLTKYLYVMDQKCMCS